MADNEHVNTTTTRLGRDGKLYRATPLSRRERGDAIRRAHALVHRDGLSIRAAQKVMAESHGVRRSVGVIAADLRDYECAACAEPEYPHT